MSNCPLYNSQNLNFTGNYNPYSLIQNGGKRKKTRLQKHTRRKKRYKSTTKKRKFRR